MHPLHRMEQIHPPTERPPAVTGGFEEGKTFDPGGPRQRRGITGHPSPRQFKTQESQPVLESVQMDEVAMPGPICGMPVDPAAQTPQAEGVEAGNQQAAFRAQYPLRFTQQLMRVRGKLQDMRQGQQIQTLAGDGELLQQAAYFTLFQVAAETMRHAVGTQAVHPALAELHGMEAEQIRSHRIEPGLLPCQHVLPQLTFEPRAHDLTSRSPDRDNESMKITAIPAFRDNYVWAIHDDHAAILVDPGEAAPILAWLAARNIIPSALLVTHHHADHTGGIAALCARYPVPVYAPAVEFIPGTTHPLQGGETLAFPELGVEFTVLATPGHTRGHLCYHGQGTLFCGDTLFSCGCGRLFEGTPAQMHAALDRIRALPPDTQVCCAHEYTLENLDFALAVEPDNPALQQRLAEVKELRACGTPTLPVSLATEISTNPFLRFDQAAVVVAASQHAKRPVQPGLAAFTVLRAWRDTL